jgi:hypothetical protein
MSKESYDRGHKEGSKNLKNGSGVDQAFSELNPFTDKDEHKGLRDSFSFAPKYEPPKKSK